MCILKFWEETSLFNYRVNTFIENPLLNQFIKNVAHIRSTGGS